MNAPTARPDGDDGWAMTFAFWATLLAAGGLFAAVSLTPKLETLANLDADYAANQLRLVELERQAIELEKVAGALEHDPAFAAEVAKLEFAAGSAGGERIAVSEELRLGGTEPATPAVAPAAPRPVILAELLGPLASRRGLRVGLLAISAALVLFAFLFLTEEQAATVRAAVRNSGAAARSLTDRYRKTPEGRDAAVVARRRDAA